MDTGARGGGCAGEGSIGNKAQGVCGGNLAGEETTDTGLMRDAGHMAAPRPEDRTKLLKTCEDGNEAPPNATPVPKNVSVRQLDDRGKTSDVSVVCKNTLF